MKTKTKQSGNGIAIEEEFIGKGIAIICGKHMYIGYLSSINDTTVTLNKAMVGDSNSDVPKWTPFADVHINIAMIESYFEYMDEDEYDEDTDEDVEPKAPNKVGNSVN